MTGYIQTGIFDHHKIHFRIDGDYIFVRRHFSDKPVKRRIRNNTFTFNGNLYKKPEAERTTIDELLIS